MTHIGGTDHLMSWIRNGKVKLERDRAQAKAVAQPADSFGPAGVHDERERLRGIPCLTEGGIGSAIPGTQPEVVCVMRAVRSGR